MDKKNKSNAKSIEENTAFIGLRVSPKLKKELETAASVAHVSLTQIVTRMLNGDAWTQKQQNIFRTVIGELLQGKLGYDIRVQRQ